jgi:O-antigen/teichoic acid export membrane protein
MIKTTRADHLWSYSGTAFNYGVNLLLLPLILKMLTVDELGLWYTFAGIQSLVMVLDFGFSTTLKRFVAYAWSGAESLDREGTDNVRAAGQPNYNLFASVFSACRRICLLVSAASFVILLSLGTVYVMSITRDYSLANRYLLPWAVFVLAVTINIYYNYWSNALTGIGAISYNQKATVISKLIQLLAVVLGFLSGLGLIALAGSYLLSGLAFRAVAKRFLLRYRGIGAALKSRGDIARYETGGVIRTMWFTARKAGVSTLASSLKRQSGTLICSSVFGVTVTASYGLCLQVITIISSLAQIHFVTSIPSMSGCRLAKDNVRLGRIFSLSMVMFYLISLAGNILFITIGIPLVSLLKPGTSLPVPLAALMAFTLILEQNWSLSAGFIATGNRLPHVRSLVVTSVLVICLSATLAVYTGAGIYGLLAAQLLAECCYMSWKWPCFALKELGLTFFGMLGVSGNELKRAAAAVLARPGGPAGRLG